MPRIWLLISCGVALTIALGGCPASLAPDVEEIPGGGGSTGTGGSAGPATAGTQAVNDELAEQFPGCTEPASGQAWRDEILRLVNEERQREGLSAVVRNDTLEEQATQYACELIYYDFFAHVNPMTGSELRDRALEFEYDYLIIGENLAAGQSTPAEAVTAWMNSEKHRENILNPEFTELGVGVRTGGRYGTYWVQEFGRPLPSGLMVFRR